MSGMKAKTIKTIISKKFDAVLASIEDETVREVLRKNAIFTGGSIASMLLGEPVNDFDVYLRTKQAAVAVAKYYVARFAPKAATGIACNIYVDDETDRVKVVIKSAGIATAEGTERPYEYFEGAPDERAADYVSGVMTNPGDIEDMREETEAASIQDNEDGKPAFRPIFMSTNAITLAGKVQIVLRFYGEADTIHENYDFVHCTNYWTSWNGELTLRQAALEALLAKELRYVGSKYPVCSIIRLRKFIARGWRINAGQILKMAMQVSELDLTDPAVLEDQLTGVDAAYFVQLMQRLKEKDPEKVNAAYLVEIINRMF